MQIPTEIARTGIVIEDQYFDLKGLSSYSSLGLSSLRSHIRSNGLPCYSIRNEKGAVTKLLVKRSEFDRWMENNWRDNLDTIVDEVIEDLIS